MSFISVGIDHEHAPLDLLERATVVEEQWGKVLGTLLANANIHEAVFLSTCLRTEVYASIDRFHGAVEEITETLSSVTGVSSKELTEFLTIHFDRGVASHLFQVAGGLRSVVPGEYEVLGQLRRSLERADEEHAVGPELAELFRRSLVAGRRVRHETTIARGTTSFAQATVAMAQRELGEQLHGANVVVLGAGQLASGIVRNLVTGSAPLGSITIVNRTTERARTLRDEVGDARVEVKGLDDLESAVRSAQLVITAIESTTPLLRDEHVSGITGPLLIIDLGMPRVVSTSIETQAHVRRIDISALHDTVEAALVGRYDALDQASAILDEEVEKFHEDRRSRGAAAIVSELREYLDTLRRRELERRESDLSDLTAEQRERVDSLTRSIVAKIAHDPTIALKEAAGTDRGQRLADATRTLFDL
jgi:glutamyl-tRNA reductase